MKWQPIATAPKDGTEIIIWRACRLTPQHPNPRQVTIASWRNTNHCDSFTWRSILGAWEKPTHWMRLPKPPKDTQ